MKVLVSVASKHGSTEGIGHEIAARLRAANIDVDVVPAGTTPSIAKYDACVIGGAIYMGRWMSQARDLLKNNVELLKARPVWLFSSGPIGEKRDPADSAEGDRLLAQIGGREHRLFAGSIKKEELGLGERMAIRMVKAPYGDYRPWAEIGEWADSIAKELTAVPV
jgi:menaquinone-dependent protoporphyrinogen oxidase